MRDDTTAGLGKRLTKHFQASGLSVDEYLIMMKGATDINVVDIKLTHQVPKWLSDNKRDTESYATMHFIHNSAVVSASTWPDKGPDWHCKY